MPREQIDFTRLVYAWQAQEQYDDVPENPWDPGSGLVDDEASNAIGSGWACRIGRAILVEESSGAHVPFLYESDEEAVSMWDGFAILYSDAREEDPS